MKATIHFKRHGEEWKQNVKLQDAFTKDDALKAVKLEVKKRWPNVMGCVQQIEIRKG